MSDDPRDRIYPGADYPELNQNANGAVSIEVGSPLSPDGRSGHVILRVRDRASNEILVSVEINRAQMWTLIQGGIQSWPAFISPHLDRVGKKMENVILNLPPVLDGDTDRDVRRDVTKAAWEQYSGTDWADQWEDYDSPRVNNRRQWYTILRRWVEVS